ncbi:MAG: erythromycin esterase family protein [Bacteroidota bacterium]|nr:erythromycin esterase family protein [Bacteroidota bacterium]
MGIDIKLLDRNLWKSYHNSYQTNMYKKHLLLPLIISLILCSCSKDPEGLNLDPETQTLVNILQDELLPLGADPLNWEDQDLRWLDPLANKSIVGLGEATHGTAEFFDAKHRIFRYLVENHGYKVFAFEADFGESLFIEEAVQQGNSAEIEELMNSKMHFWTWKTEEVKELLEWMCTYNQGKAEEEKVHYMGVDCQFNTYHIDMASTYLEGKGLPFQSYADSILSEAAMAYEESFESYDSGSFEIFIQKLEALQDSVTQYKDLLVAGSSEKAYQLNERIVEVIRQVSVVRYSYTGNLQTYVNYRDKYMAENTSWLLDYFDNDKVVVWAHNYHISDFESGNMGTMGNYLRYALWDQYATVGFLFSRGTFTAVGMEGENFTELGTQSLDSIPRAGSLNALMSYTGEAAFSVEVDALANYLAWYNAFEKGMQYFFMGSGYNNRPGDYYVSFDPDLYHYLIYFDKSTASVLLN